DAHGLRPGTVVAGRYEVIRELRREGGSLLYKVRHLDLDEAYALLVLDPASAADPTHCERFLHRAKLAARHDHPNSIALRATGLAEGMPYMVLDLVEAPTLAEVLARGPLAPRRAVAIARKVIQAIATAHEVGLRYERLDPGGIFLETLPGGLERVRLAFVAD